MSEFPNVVGQAAGPSYWARLSREARKKLGPAWTRKGRPPAGSFTRKTAEQALAAILAGAVKTGATFRGREPRVAAGRTTGSAAAGASPTRPTSKFVDDVGGHVDDWRLRRRFHDALDRAELPRLRLHDLRHTFGTLAVQATDQRPADLTNASAAAREQPFTLPLQP